MRSDSHTWHYENMHRIFKPREDRLYGQKRRFRRSIEIQVTNSSNRHYCLKVQLKVSLVPRTSLHDYDSFTGNKWKFLICCTFISGLRDAFKGIRNTCMICISSRLLIALAVWRYNNSQHFCRV